MYELNKILRECKLKPNAYKKIGKITVVNSDKGKYVAKKKEKDDTEIFRYLKSRNFDYYPFIIKEDNDYKITKFIDEVQMPKEQKMLDMIDLVALLHSKTTYYETLDIEDNKKIYEDIINNIDYLFGYYNDVITIIETKVFMSPSEYLMARNISSIFEILNICKIKIDEWYELVKDSKKKRYVVVHNNLDLDHFLVGQDVNLISWNKSKIDMPIFDLYKLYRKYNLDFDFETILKRYELTYPLLEEEKRLLIILMMLPDKIEWNDTEYNMCKKIGKMFEQINQVRTLPNYSKNTKSNPEK